MIEFSNKKVAVLGLGVEGQSLVNYLLERKALVTVFDQKEKFDFDVDSLKRTGVVFVLGSEYLKDGFNNFDFVFRSPGFLVQLPQLLEASKSGVVITSATKLFFDLCQGKIIGVTGTKGKGTTASLIYEILKADKKDVFLAGNIGTPMLDLLDKIKKDSWVILELSSFQLEDLDKGPHLSVILFVSQEHLDHHKNIEEYHQAKGNIVRFQNENDLAVFNADDQNSSSFASLAKGEKYYFSRLQKTNGAYVLDNQLFIFDNLLGDVKDLKLIGAHNQDNVCAAVTATFLAKASLPSIKQAVFNFTGLEHRLEKVATVDNIDFYNDSFATTPEATIVAVEAFKKPVVLIAGGSDKGSDYTKLGEKIANSSVKVLILIGQMAEKIRQAVLAAGFKGEIIFQLQTMDEILRVCLQKAVSGGVVLLSPACASFGMFKDYKDRGNQFKNGVKALQK